MAPTQTYRVPSHAMAPSLLLGEHVTASLDPDYTPRVGDIVVFHPPSGADAATPICGDPQQGARHSAACSMPTSQRSSSTFIKRIVAGPGDTLQIRNGCVLRNGRAAQEPYVQPCDTDPSGNFLTPIVIPPDHYFLLGDNRRVSNDSRFWGPVPRAWIIGDIRTPAAVTDGLTASA
jgi:signal peptidase I